MKRHIIAGQFSSYDQVSVSSGVDELVTYLNFYRPRHKYLNYGIGQALENLVSFGITPSEIGVDLLILAAHIFAADTRISRKTESQDSWTREIHLLVPVSEPDKWKSVADILVQMLKFLTGDLWTVGFRPRPRGFSQIVPVKSKQKHSSQYTNIALFSGGLDSLIGAIDSFEMGQTPLFISHAGEGAPSRAQDICFKYLRNYYDNRLTNRLRVWMNFPNNLVQGVNGENTTRGRSFLFFAIGVFAGSGFDGGFTLNAPENGLIALNVPLDQMRLGALSTRTMHPFYLEKWNELINGIGIQGTIKNPYWKLTKGEMVRDCQNIDLLQKLVPSSLSCSSPAKGRWKGRGTEHCGYCLPCLIRRAALEKVFGTGGDPTQYTISDLTARVLDANQAEGQQIRSLQFTMERLRDNPELAKLFIHKPGPISTLPTVTKSELANVYQRGMDEVASFLSGVKT